MLYERLLDLEKPRIPVHQFFGVMQEYALGNMTGAEAVAAFNLDTEETAEAVTLLNVILAESSNNGGLLRRMKAMEFERVLMLAEKKIAPYTTVEAVKTRLGV